MKETLLQVCVSKTAGASVREARDPALLQAIFLAAIYSVV
jgi:hypothetical protein